MEILFILTSLLVLGTIVYITYDAIKHFENKKVNH